MFDKKKYKGPNRRLLTAAEREFLLTTLDNRNRRRSLIIILIMLVIVFAIFNVLMGLLLGTEILLAFLPLMTFLGAIIIYYLSTMNTVLQKIRANELYVTEAIYKDLS